MRRFLTGALAVVLGLAATGLAQAGERGRGNGNGQRGNFDRRVVTNGNKDHFVKFGNNDHRAKFVHKDHGKPVHNFVVKHAKKGNFGYCYTGKLHTHWTYRCWSPSYGCNIFWDPYLCCYYYWCAPHNCFYPVSYCPTGIYAY